MTFTWDDPTIYLKPHTYELTYYKSEPGTYAFVSHAMSDAERGAVGRVLVTGR